MRIGEGDLLPPPPPPFTCSSVSFVSVIVAFGIPQQTQRCCIVGSPLWNVLISARVYICNKRSKVLLDWLILTRLRIVINVLVFLCCRMSYLHTPVISDTGKYCSDDLIVGFHPQSPKLFPTHKQYHRDLLLRSVYLNSRGFNRHRRPTRHFGHFDQRSRLLLPPKLEAESIKIKKDKLKDKKKFKKS